MSVQEATVWAAAYAAALQAGAIRRPTEEWANIRERAHVEANFALINYRKTLAL